MTQFQQFERKRGESYRQKGNIKNKDCALKPDEFGKEKELLPQSYILDIVTDGI